MHQVTTYTSTRNDSGIEDLKILTQITSTDRGLLYGDGVFETILIKNRQPLFFEAHIRRMLMALKRLNIHCGVPPKRFKEFILEDILDSGERDAILRLSATRGVTKGIGFSECKQPNFIVEIKPLQEEAPKEVILITAAERRNEHSALSTIKTLNYLSNLSARQEAIRMSAYDALLLNTSGDIAECSTANIFGIFGKELITPPLESGILPGITRGVVLSLARTAGLDEIVQKMTPEEFLKAEEVFITNSIRGIVPVKKIDQKEFLGIQGQKTQSLMTLYENEIIQELRS